MKNTYRLNGLFSTVRERSMAISNTNQEQATAKLIALITLH